MNAMIAKLLTKLKMQLSKAALRSDPMQALKIYFVIKR